MLHLPGLRLLATCLLIAVPSQGQDLVNITINHGARDSKPAWSPDGTLIAFISVRTGSSEIFTMHPDGSEETQLTSERFNDDPSWSPDSQKLAFSSSREREGYRIYTMNKDGTQVQKLTQDPPLDLEPAWSLDGQEIVFTSLRAGHNQIWIMNADGTDQRQLTHRPTGGPRNPFWMLAEKILFTSHPEVGFVQHDIFVMNPDGSSIIPLTQTPWNEYQPVGSPDGTKIAFASEKEDTDPLYTNDSGIYVMDTDGKNVRRLSPFPGIHVHPTWSPDGEFIAFENVGDGDIYVMSSRRNVTAVESESWGKIKAHQR